MMPSLSLRVVIADDEALVCNLIQAELEKIGHRVVGRASDGHQAVELTQATQPDLVLLDIAMPEMDGLAAAREIQERVPTPIVLLTAHDNPELVREASRLGIGAYLIKPPSARELDRALVLSLARHADLMQLRKANARLQQELTEVKTLSGLLPVCAGCKCIRDDKGAWQEIEVYLQARTNATFTHGICPKCVLKYYPELAGGMYPP
jgi:AmiR/NasT family two-component response regulator